MKLNRIFDRDVARQQLRTLLALAIPSALQTLLNFAVNLLDSVMLGSLGEIQISAAALANQVFFVLSLIIYGIVGGSNVLVAQFWGKKDRDSISRVMAYTYRVGIAFALVFTVLSLAIPQHILSIFSPDLNVISEGVPYLRIVAISYLFYSITTLTGGALRSVRNVRISLVLSIVSLFTNGILNYILIFGKCGFPAMGIIGAGIATTVARLVEFGVLMLYMAFKEKDLQLRVRPLLKLDRSLAGRYFKTTTPVICNEVFWSLGSSVLTIIMGHMSTEYVAANSIFGNINQLSGALAQGLCAAGAVLIGNTIGEGDRGRVMSLTRLLQVVGLLSGFVTATFILILRPIMLSFYNVSDLTMLYANQITYTGAFVAVFRNAQSMNMMGILRGGGDAKFVMVNDVIFLWVLAIPLGFLAGLVWHLPVPIVYCALNIEQFFKLFTSTWRLRNGRWITNVTNEE